MVGMKDMRMPLMGIVLGLVMMNQEKVETSLMAMKVVTLMDMKMARMIEMRMMKK